MSLRFSPGKGINNIKKSYQPIAWDDKGKPTEIANYVVFNAQEFFRKVERFKPQPCRVYGYGYWGSPSKTAVTLYQELVFGVIIVQKMDTKDKKTKIAAQLDMPLDFLNKL